MKGGCTQLYCWSQRESSALLLAIKCAVERVREFLGWRDGRSQDKSWAAEGVIRSDGQENRGLREE